MSRGQRVRFLGRRRGNFSGKVVGRRSSAKGARSRRSAFARSYAAPRAPSVVPVGERRASGGWGKWVAIGGVAAVGAVLLYKLRGSFRAQAQAPSVPTKLGPAGLLPSGLFPAQQGQTPFEPGLTTPVAPSPTATLKPGVQVVETKPGVIQMTTADGKKKKLTPKQTAELLPAMVNVRGQWIPMPNDAGKKGTEKLDAQQDLCDIGVIRGWLTQVATTKAGVPKYSIPGDKKKMARAAAVKYVKSKLVLESLNMRTSAQTSAQTPMQSYAQPYVQASGFVTEYAVE